MAQFNTVQPWPSQLQVLVAAIPFAQCFVLGTKLAPEMTDQVTQRSLQEHAKLCVKGQKAVA